MTLRLIDSKVFDAYVEMAEEEHLKGAEAPPGSNERLASITWLMLWREHRMLRAFIKANHGARD